MVLARLKLLLWLLAAVALTKQDMVRVNVSPDVKAECGQPVTLHCNVSSARNGLSIKHLAWVEDSRTLCELTGEGNITHHENGSRDFRCEYTERQLTLVLREVWPLDGVDSKSFMCKMRSNQGIKHGRSRIHLQECCGIVEEGKMSNTSVCKWSQVYPDGDVLWSNNSSEPLNHKVYKTVDKKGWTTIFSELQESSDVSPNCSLLSVKSGGQITCMEFRQLQFPTPFIHGGTETKPLTTSQKNGNAPLGPVGVILFIALSLSATL